MFDYFVLPGDTEFPLSELILDGNYILGHRCISNRHFQWRSQLLCRGFVLWARHGGTSVFLFSPVNFILLSQRKRRFWNRAKIWIKENIPVIWQPMCLKCRVRSYFVSLLEILVAAQKRRSRRYVVHYAELFLLLRRCTPDFCDILSIFMTLWRVKKRVFVFSLVL